MPSARVSQKRVSDPLQMELQMVISHCVSSLSPLQEQQILLTTETHLPPPPYFMRHVSH